ncbi:hypothetical protein HDG34_001774 [Paraburkholderia sp. HC6.4b]|uniref:hypothetical protein n=1 Tax=unclassified Paraburkholderia TaxID=2615204 RepID=UPI00160F6692|nr:MULTISPECIES: hypothetical protein [unclassified Paraburkholderia]MBB5407842.1 hypothetical protein [Paraburkholderia sp. HC6.4b]MBB5452145.1 hypothetical protein [Paraburkholderia sp. Kb1A]
MIFGTSTIRHIVEHDTQLKVRTKVLRLDPYGEKIEEMEGFVTFIEEMEKRLGPEFCEPGSLSSHAVEIRRGVDGRPGLVVRLATDALSQHGHERRLNWKLYSKYLNELAASSGEDLATERRVTNRPIVAAAEAPITKKAPKSGKEERNGRVGATKNTNAPNHPFGEI